MSHQNDAVDLRQVFDAWRIEAQNENRNRSFLAKIFGDWRLHLFYYNKKCRIKMLQ